jgi:hypothetical protein
VWVVSADRDLDLFDLRPLGSRLDLPADRSSLLPRLLSAASALQWLQQGQNGSRWNPRPAIVRHLHSP